MNGIVTLESRESKVFRDVPMLQAARALAVFSILTLAVLARACTVRLARR